MGDTMKEMIEWILWIWSLYWNEGFYQYLLLVSAVYLLIFHRKKSGAKQILVSLAVILFVFFCPFTAAAIRACIGSDVYWRVLWLLPLIPAVAAAAAWFVTSKKSNLLQIFLLLLVTAAIAISGQQMLKDGNFVRTANRQKIPDTAARICNIIQEAAAADGISEIRIASDDDANSYIRVYDASIQMPFGRWGKGALTKASQKLYEEIISETPHYKKLARLALRAECNFLALPQREKDPHAALAKYGYVEIGTSGSYTVYQLKES